MKLAVCSTLCSRVLQALWKGIENQEKGQGSYGLSDRGRRCSRVDCGAPHGGSGPQVSDHLRRHAEGAALPGPTQLVVGGNFMRENIVLTIIILVIGFFASKFFIKTPFDSKMFNWLSINIPGRRSAAR